MKKLTFALIFLTFAYPAAVRSQMPTTAPVREDCACESQVLPETVAIVNGVKITSSDVKKSTGDQVSQLQRQVVEARRRELDLMINSRLLELEAKKRGISTVKLLELEVLNKIKKPGQAEAQAFYDQNKTRIKAEFSEVVDDIINYLFEQQQEKRRRSLRTLCAPRVT